VKYKKLGSRFQVQKKDRLPPMRIIQIFLWVKCKLFCSHEQISATVLVTLEWVQGFKESRIPG
jgi:hypothetical protein